MPSRQSPPCDSLQNSVIALIRIELATKPGMIAVFDALIETLTSVKNTKEAVAVPVQVQARQSHVESLQTSWSTEIAPQPQPDADLLAAMGKVKPISVMSPVTPEQRQAIILGSAKGETLEQLTARLGLEHETVVSVANASRRHISHLKSLSGCHADVERYAELLLSRLYPHDPLVELLTPDALIGVMWQLAMGRSYRETAAYLNLGEDVVRKVEQVYATDVDALENTIDTTEQTELRKTMLQRIRDRRGLPQNKPTRTLQSIIHG